MSNLWKKLGKRARSENGAIAVVVSLLVAILLGSSAVAAGVGAYETARVAARGAAESLALEGARWCQTHPAAQCTSGNVKAYLSGLARANKVTVGTVTVTTPYASTFDTIDDSVKTSTGTRTLTRSKIQVSASGAYVMPMASLIGRSTNNSVSASRSATWTDNGAISALDAGNYLPLMMNKCLAIKLAVPSKTGYRFYDNEPCSSTDKTPSLWWFGNAGANAASCFASYKNTIQSGLENVANTVGAEPTPNLCEGTYWLPVFSQYITPIAKYTIVWNLTISNTKTSFDIVETKDCSTDIVAYSASTGCMTVSTVQTPSKGTPCVPGKSGCVLKENSRVSTPVDGKPYGVVEKFMRFTLKAVEETTNPAQPYHYYTFGYSGHDIRLLPDLAN